MKKIVLLFAFCLVVFASGVHAKDNSRVIIQITGSEFVGSEHTNDISINNVSVYPNPVSDMLKISFKSSKQDKVVITLFNTIGNPVVVDQTETSGGNNLFTIDIRKNEIVPGIYFVQIAAGNEVITRKLVVK